MHQTKKGKDWHFGMKAHVGVDRKTKLIHSVAATPANVADGNLVASFCTERKRMFGATPLARAELSALERRRPRPRTSRSGAAGATGT
jgi:IS5 family transposase